MTQSEIHRMFQIAQVHGGDFERKLAAAGLVADPDNVGKVGELRESLALAIESVDTDDAGLVIDVRELVLHKRRKASRKS